MQNISPNAEPVTWAAVVAAIVAALASYGLNITTELAHLLVLIAPFIGAALIARFRVWAPDTHDAAVNAAYERGKSVAATTTPPAPRRNVKPQEGIARYTNVGKG